MWKLLPPMQRLLSIAPKDVPHDQADDESPALDEAVVER